MKPRYLSPPPPRYHFTNSRRTHIDAGPPRCSQHRQPLTIVLLVATAFTTAATLLLGVLVWLNG